MCIVFFSSYSSVIVSDRGSPYNYFWKVSTWLLAQGIHEVLRHGEKRYRKTVIRQFTRPHALCIGLGPIPMSHVETNCIIQNHHISDSSHAFSVCSSRRICLFETAHYSRPIILQHICCCVKPLVIHKDTTILHEIHVSVNILCFCDSQSSVLILGSDTDVHLSIRSLPVTLRCPNISPVPCQTTMCASLLFYLTHLRGVPYPRNATNLATLTNPSTSVGGTGAQ